MDTLVRLCLSLSSVLEMRMCPEAVIAFTDLPLQLVCLQGMFHPPFIPEPYNDQLCSRVGFV